MDALDRQQRELERKRAWISATVAALDDPLAAEDLVGRLALIGKQIAALGRDRVTVLARQATWQAEIDDLCDLEARCREVKEALSFATEYEDRRRLLQLVAVQPYGLHGRGRRAGCGAVGASIVRRRLLQHSWGRWSAKE